MRIEVVVISASLANGFLFPAFLEHASLHGRSFAARQRSGLNPAQAAAAPGN
jgi:hypothetical protein